MNWDGVSVASWEAVSTISQGMILEGSAYIILTEVSLHVRRTQVYVRVQQKGYEKPRENNYKVALIFLKK